MSTYKYGTPITALMRELLIREGMEFDKAIKLSEEFDARCKASSWLELLDGTTYDGQIDPSVYAKLYGSPKTYVKAWFTIDGEGKTFVGYHAHDRWNGWYCPCFEFDEAMRIASTYGGRYLDKKDRFVFEDDDFYGGHYVYASGKTRRVYSIGAWAWIWDIVEVGE